MKKLKNLDMKLKNLEKIFKNLKSINQKQKQKSLFKFSMKEVLRV